MTPPTHCILDSCPACLRDRRAGGFAFYQVGFLARRVEVFDTLLNPRRPVGATHIHGIRDADVRDAPHFEDIIDNIRGLVDGSAMVAHNASFEERMLHGELARLGGRFGVPRYSTAMLSRRLYPERRGLGSNTLDRLCTLHRVRNPCPHRALGDAFATACILADMLARNRDHPRLHAFLREVRRNKHKTTKWPKGRGRRDTSSSSRQGHPGRGML